MYDANPNFIEMIRRRSESDPVFASDMQKIADEAGFSDVFGLIESFREKLIALADAGLKRAEEIARDESVPIGEETKERISRLRILLDFMKTKEKKGRTYEDKEKS
jgi:hypothetical protein